MTLAGKRIFITGATRGIGKALVDAALARGIRRVYAGTRGEPGLADPRVTWVSLDVTSVEQARRAAEAVGELDVLVNNAAVCVPGDLADVEALAFHFGVNCVGLLEVTRAFLPALRRSHGAIVNQLSLAGLASVPVMAAYSLSKAAAHNATQALRALLAPDGVAVHAVLLGPVDTDLSRSLHIPKASPASVAARILDEVEAGHDDIFPDPASEALAEPWATGLAKQLEKQFAAFTPAEGALR
jgi:NAD(P)-dependent dehydrogenase (short-subunit alcohol dehydrogenase family)